MKLIVFIFLSIISFTSSASREYARSYYSDGTIKSEGWLQDNKKVDFWTFYYSNGKVKEKGHYTQNLRTKYWHFYNENGIVKSEGHYVAGKRNNWWSFYNTTGHLIHKCQLQNGIKNGYCLHYKSNEIVKASKYSQGKKQEEWTDYSLFTRENNLLDLR